MRPFTNSRHPGPLITAALGLAIALTTFVLSEPRDASGAVAESWVTYGAPELIPSLRSEPEAVQRLSHLAAALADAHKADFLGSYVDGGEVVIVAATSKGTALAEKQFAGVQLLTLRESDVSTEDAAQLGAELRSLSPALANSLDTWGGDPVHAGIFVSLLSDPSDEDRQIIATFAAQRALRIRVEIEPASGSGTVDDNRPTDPSPYAGGARIAIADGPGTNASVVNVCSVAFGYKIGETGYMLTAGHCFPRNNGSNDFMWIMSGTFANATKVEYAGRKCCSTWNRTAGTVDESGLHGDLALVSVSDAGNVAGTTVWWGEPWTTSKLPLDSRSVPAPGDPICINGATSGSNCGELVVQSTNVSHAYSDGTTITNGDRASSIHADDCSRGGDSGGSVVFDHVGAETHMEALGVVSGHTKLDNGGCDQWFTGVEEAMQAWGGGLKYD